MRPICRWGCMNSPSADHVPCRISRITCLLIPLILHGHFMQLSSSCQVNCTGIQALPCSAHTTCQSCTEGYDLAGRGQHCLWSTSIQRCMALDESKILCSGLRCGKLYAGSGSSCPVQCSQRSSCHQWVVSFLLCSCLSELFQIWIFLKPTVKFLRFVSWLNAQIIYLGEKWDVINSLLPTLPTLWYPTGSEVGWLDFINQWCFQNISDWKTFQFVLKMCFDLQIAWIFQRQCHFRRIILHFVPAVCSSHSNSHFKHST